MAQGRFSHGISMDIDVQEQDVERLLNSVNTVLNPISMMGFLSLTVAPFIRRRAEARFAGEGDDVSGKWAPLSPATQEIREGLDLPISGDHPINRRTDDLYTYITKSPDEVMPLGGMGAQLTYPSPSATINPGIEEKMKTAQQGRRNPHTIPRPVLGLGIGDLTYVVGALGIAVRKAGGMT